MAIDTAEKRKSVAGIGLPCYGPGVSVNVSHDLEWRQQVGYGYSGIATGTGLTVAQQMDWRFSPPDVARGRRPNVRTGQFSLEPIYTAPPAETVTIDKWLGSRLDRMWGHKPRPFGGMTAATPIRPEPTVDAWAFHQPDFARTHKPRPQGGVTAPIPMRPEVSLEMWEFKPPDFAGRSQLPLTRTGVTVVDPTTPPDPIPACSWLPVYPDIVRGPPPRPRGGMSELLPPELLTCDKWINYLPVMTPKSHPWSSSRAWYHPAYQAPFTVSDFVHTDHMQAAWFMVPAIVSRFGTKPAIEATFDLELSLEGTQGMNP